MVLSSLYYATVEVRHRLNQRTRFREQFSDLSLPHFSTLDWRDPESAKRTQGVWGHAPRKIHTTADGIQDRYNDAGVDLRHRLNQRTRFREQFSDLSLPHCSTLSSSIGGTQNPDPGGLGACSQKKQPQMAFRGDTKILETGAPA
jgi:hypothetical protein